MFVEQGLKEKHENLNQLKKELLNKLGNRTDILIRTQLLGVFDKDN